MNTTLNSLRKKNAIKLYDRNRKREQKSNQVNISNSIPSYKNVLCRSKRIHELLGSDHKVHSHILSHVLKHSFYSPKKRKSVAKQCKALLKCLESELDSEDNFKMPLKNLNEMLRKVAVYRSMKKHNKEAIWLYAELFLGHHDGSCHGLW